MQSTPTHRLHSAESEPIRLLLLLPLHLGFSCSQSSPGIYIYFFFGGGAESAPIGRRNSGAVQSKSGFDDVIKRRRSRAVGRRPPMACARFLFGVWILPHPFQSDHQPPRSIHAIKRLCRDVIGSSRDDWTPGRALPHQLAPSLVVDRQWRQRQPMAFDHPTPETGGQGPAWRAPERRRRLAAPR